MLKLALRLTFTLFATTLLMSCSATSHLSESAELGRSAASSEMLAQLHEPGPIVFEKLVAAHWRIDRAGLINLDHPEAKSAGLESGEEPIDIYFYRITHPRYGTYIIDSGVAENFRGGNPRDVSWIVKSAMNIGQLDVQLSIKQWLENYQGELKGVFLTHIHLDHIFGLADVPSTTPVYVGPGETKLTSFTNAFSQGTTDRLLSYVGNLREWQFSADSDKRFDGVIDVFGDGSLWALHVPGHTPGSTAFVVRTTTGPHLVLGDATHTAWGWQHGVEPGDFSADKPRSAASLAKLKKLVEQAQPIQVHPGHQSLPSDLASTTDMANELD